MPIHPNRILIHYGEIALKGRNRADFETALSRNIEHRLRHAGLAWPVRRGRGQVYVEVPQIDADRPLGPVLEVISETAGIVWFAPAVWFEAAAILRDFAPPDLEPIESTVVALARAGFAPQASFAVRVHRADKHFPLTSQALERRLGTCIIERSDWARVRLNGPDRTFHVDIDADGVSVYADKLRGVGGLPVGTEGRVLALLSGGIDSPVAAYLMAKRGCRVDFIHMTASHAQQRDAEHNPVGQLARALSRYTLRSRLHLVPSTHFDIGLMSGKTQHGLVLFRRFLAQAAERLARRTGAQALVSGDSLGQVASQTLENMVTTSMAVAMPILRPLIGYDKHEIVELARRIGTFEISTQPYKDCCALLARHPRTRSHHRRLAAIEDALFPDYRALVDATLADAVCLEFECGERAG